MNAVQEPKYRIEGDRIVNRQSGEAIPEDEPVMIFRARDMLAAEAIAYYYRRVENDDHRRAVGLRLDQFNRWAADHPGRMHEADTDLTSDWPGFKTPAQPIESRQPESDPLNGQWQRERSSTQMTLGVLIGRLEGLAPTILVGIGNPHSYRGYYCDLAFEPIGTRAGEALEMCRKCMGEVFIGYKGGDFQMGKNTPVWVAHYGSCGKKITGIADDGTMALADDEA